MRDGRQHQLPNAGRAAELLSIVLAKLHRCLLQLGLSDIRVKVLYPGFQHQLIHFICRLAGDFFFPSGLNRPLLQVPFSFGRFQRPRVAIFIRCPQVKRRIKHGAFGIAVDSPRGDPGYLIFKGFFETDRRLRGIILSSLFVSYFFA